MLTFLLKPKCCIAVRIISVALTVTGMLTVLSLIPAIAMSVINTGTYAGAGMGLFTFLVGLFMPHMLYEKKGAAKAAYIAILSIFSLLLIYAVVLSAAMLSKLGTAVHTDGKTLVVLGCQVNDNGPSLMLKSRLDTAYELLSRDETLICVVSGGKGETEPCEEAEAMKNYLVGKGISESRIIKEDNSANTLQNLENSKRLIAENGLPENIVIVTDGFHALRASMFAERLGYESAECAASHTPLPLLSTYWIREWLALSYYLVVGI